MRQRRKTAVWQMLAATLMLSVAACSTAEYDAPIKAFKDAADAAANSTAKVNTVLAEATLDYAVKSAARDPAQNHLLREANDCAAYNPTQEVRCRARFELNSSVGAGHSVKLQRKDYSDPLGGMVGILQATQEYATNLLAVEQANTAEQVNNSVDSIQASLVQIAKAAGNNDFKDQIPQAAGEAVKWAFGQYIESVKFDALRRATSAAKSPLSLAQMVFTEMEKSAKITLSSSALETANDTIQKMDPHSEASIRTALNAQNAYDDLLTAPLSSMFDNLVEAHENLAKALDEGSHLSLRQALAKLDDIQKQAEALGKIADDLQNALKKKPAP